MPPLYYRGCWHRVSRGFLSRYRQANRLFNDRPSSLTTGFYDPKTFITHAALLRQAFAHCAKFPTAASRRSLDRVSVPVWPITLSGRLLIVALVGRYPTNWLIRRRTLSLPQALRSPGFTVSVPANGLMRYYHSFRSVIPHKEVGFPRVTHPSAMHLAAHPTCMC